MNKIQEQTKMSEATPISVSRIRTTCEVPDGTVLRWIVALFPELADDCSLSSVSSNYRGGISFEVEHTVQAPKPAGPIRLAPLAGDDAVIGACTDDG